MQSKVVGPASIEIIVTHGVASVTIESAAVLFPTEGLWYAEHRLDDTRLKVLIRFTKTRRFDRPHSRVEKRKSGHHFFAIGLREIAEHNNLVSKDRFRNLKRALQGKFMLERCSGPNFEPEWKLSLVREISSVWLSRAA